MNTNSIYIQNDNIAKIKKAILTKYKTATDISKEEEIYQVDYIKYPYINLNLFKTLTNSIIQKIYNDPDYLEGNLRPFRMKNQFSSFKELNEFLQKYQSVLDIRSDIKIGLEIVEPNYLSLFFPIMKQNKTIFYVELDNTNNLCNDRYFKIVKKENGSFVKIGFTNGSSNILTIDQFEEIKKKFNEGRELFFP